MVQPIVEKRWEYKGFTCVVIFQTLAHRCGYVAIPKDHSLYKVDCMNMDISCHGGLTYSDSELYGQDDKNVWWIGFDCNHYGDRRDYETAREYFGKTEAGLRLLEMMDVKFNTFDTFQSARTLDYCINECEQIVEQLLSESVEL